MTARTIAVTTILTAVVALASGCDDSAVRQLALQLRNSVAEDEKLVDEQIAHQVKFYNTQQQTIERSREANNYLQREAGRRMRSAEAATAMSLNPRTEVRLATVMRYLHETHDKEFELWKKDNADEQAAREKLRGRIAKLERQKKALTQIKKNLDQLAVNAGSKKRALFILQYSRDTYTKIKASTQ